MDIYKSSEITVHRLNELREEDKKIQILDVREDTERDHAHVHLHRREGSLLEVVRDHGPLRRGTHGFPPSIGIKFKGRGARNVS